MCTHQDSHGMLYGLTWFIPEYLLRYNPCMLATLSMADWNHTIPLYKGWSKSSAFTENKSFTIPDVPNLWDHYTNLVTVSIHFSLQSHQFMSNVSYTAGDLQNILTNPHRSPSNQAISNLSVLHITNTNAQGMFHIKGCTLLSFFLLKKLDTLEATV